MCDPIRIGQALDNLIDNSLRYGAGTITLAARRRASVVELHVRDDGGGFPAAFLPRAFERFSRADERALGPGSGLGLAIVQAIARAHGGDAHGREPARKVARTCGSHCPRLPSDPERTGP